MKVHKLTLLFSDVDLLVAGLEHQYDRAALTDCEHFILDDFWPLNRDDNLRVLQNLKRRHGNLKILHSPANLGIHHGLNYALTQMQLEDNDLFIVTAPDSVPLQKGWDEALVKVMDGMRECAFAGLSSIATRTTPNIFWRKRVVNGINIDIPSAPAMHHTTIFRYSFVRSAGGFNQPTKYYGHIEADLWHKAVNAGMVQAYLSDFGEDDRLCKMHPKIYEEWKGRHAGHLSPPFPGSFAEFLDVARKDDALRFPL